jgi:REP element-mobilizing transposase RayT
MPQSLARILVRLVFSTKNREPFIADNHRNGTFNDLGGTLDGIGCSPICPGGVADHVHLLLGLSRTLSISDVVEELKKQSSKWAKENVHPAFYWQNG